LFAVLIVPEGTRRSLCHAGNLQQCRFTVEWAELHTAAIDQLFDPSGDKEETPPALILFVEPLVAAAKPAKLEGFGIRVRAFEIALHHVVPANADFPALARAQFLPAAVGAENRHLVRLNRTANARIAIIEHPVTVFVPTQINRQVRAI